VAVRDTLVVFVRYPIPGRGKTRLARGLGVDNAFRLYEAFLEDLTARFSGGAFSVRWAVAPPDEGFAERFGRKPSSCFLQEGADLGARMHAAFLSQLASPEDRCIVVGSDMPHLSRACVQEAFARLDTADVVLGPARDGGYYLIGMREPHDLFDGMVWSVDSVLRETLERADAMDLRVARVASDFDVDEVEDLARLRHRLEEEGAPDCPATAAVLAGLAQEGPGCEGGPAAMHCTLVSHTHWDREWYRTFQAFRARLVDAIDRVLDLVSTDPGFRFLLDGQTIVLEDYLEIRPERRSELESACRAGRIAIGPWYVQPDSLLPGGETHIRNLLEGRRVGREFGGVSTVAYTPDSFGHPAQFPQILAGFGLGPFVYWRGNGAEIEDLPAEYRWQSPDGTSVLAHHLGEGYFGAAGLPQDPVNAAAFLSTLAGGLAARTTNRRVLFMNGIDHAIPDPGVGLALEALRRATGWTVERGVLEDFARGLSEEAPVFAGELVGGKIANLLPGVWSARLWLKLLNREAETALTSWAEPWAAIARASGLRDERASLRVAWRSLLCNQAHDSICGCSQDRVHEQGRARYDVAIELARETTARCLERLAGLDAARRLPWSADYEVAVFNPSPHPRTDLVRVPVEADTWVEYRGEHERSMQVHPALGGTMQTDGYTVDGAPARMVREPGTPRLRLDPDRPALTVETVVRDVPAFGWKRIRLDRSEAHLDEIDDGRTIEVDDRQVSVTPDGRLDIRFGERLYRGLAGLEDLGDRGDTYDFDPVEAPGEPRLESTRVERRRHPSGLASILVERVFTTPIALDEDRRTRSTERIASRLAIEARLHPDVGRVDLDIELDNAARDHRLRLLFPTSAGAQDAFYAAGTSDVNRRMPGPRDAAGWVHPAPSTFVQQGFVHAGGLTVVAPGLPEAEVTEEGVVAITLVRSVGWLALMDLVSRPIPAGPIVETPQAQCSGSMRVRLSLIDGYDPQAARDFEAGMLAVPAGEAPHLPPGQSMLTSSSRAVLVEALKPAEDGEGIILRLLNPSDEEVRTRVQIGWVGRRATPVRLDESVDGKAVELRDGVLDAVVGAHALRTFRID
jgi:mannosylglycerate hydrolase